MMFEKHSIVYLGTWLNMPSASTCPNGQMHLRTSDSDPSLSESPSSEDLLQEACNDDDHPQLSGTNLNYFLQSHLARTVLGSDPATGRVATPSQRAHNSPSNGLPHSGSKGTIVTHIAEGASYRIVKFHPPSACVCSLALSWSAMGQ
eukprot:2065061-Amphidinium_carterae.1